MKKIIVLVLSLIMVVALASCGGGDSDGGEKSSKNSKTYELFKDISESKGFTMDIESEIEGTEVQIVMATKGDKMYMEMTGGGLNNISISDGEFFYNLDPATMTGFKTTESMGMEEEFSTFFEIGGQEEEPMTTGEIEVNGKTYMYEEFGGDSAESMKLCFDGDELVYMISNGEVEETIKVNSLKAGVDESLFKVPSGYTITEF